MSNPLVSYSQFAAKVLRRTKTRWNVWSSTSHVIFTLSAGLKSLSGFFFPCWVMPFWCYTGADCTCCLWVLLFHWPRCIAKQNPGQSGITECCQKQLIVICVEEHIEINNPSASRHAIQATVMWEEIVLRKKKIICHLLIKLEKQAKLWKEYKTLCPMTMCLYD